jgi:hypothetical protein
MNFANEGPDFIFEDNPLKQDLYTPGMSIEIRQPAWLFPPDAKILWVPLAWNFYGEIVDKIKFRRGAYKDAFLRYFPEFKVD